MTTITRDYSLQGAETDRAFERGLAEAQWYRPPIDPARLRDLSLRTNGRAARDTALWLGLIVGFGLLTWALRDSWLVIPAFLAYAALYGGAADSRWHEMGHGSAFASPLANDVVYYLASFMLLRGPTQWRWSHVRHHTDTLVVGRDPEISFPRPTSKTDIALFMLGWKSVVPLTRTMFRHAFLGLDENTRDYTPPGEQRAVVREARMFVAILGVALVASAATGTIWPILFVGLPSLFGVWLVVFFGLTQHAGLTEDALDHRLNTRTVMMNPVFRFLYSNMNYHVEHHLFPTVPYYNLELLHEEVKQHLAPALPNTAAAYREIFTALDGQATDLTFELPDRGVPSGPEHDGVGTVDVGVRLWGTPGIDLGAAAALAIGEIRRVDVADATFAVCRLADHDIVVTDGLCTHGKAHLAEGTIIDCMIECPKHNGRFDLRTGEPMRKPVKEPLRTYAVEIRNGRIIVESDD